MKVAIYARVSLDADSEDKRYQEPENQLVPLREYAKNRGFEITEEYIDRASGGDSNRPEFKRMRNDAHQNKFSAVIVWALDRFSREGPARTYNYIEELRRFGVGVISYTESWCDTTKESPVAELILGVMAWVAKQERERISQRTKAGIARLKAIGQWKGGRPPKKREGVETDLKGPTTN